MEQVLLGLQDIRSPRVLELCGGSGCLAVTLSLERPDAEVWSVEKSEDAYRYLTRNNEALGAGVRPVLGDAFDIEIVEKHHHSKLDAPSGTALMIADAINAQAGGQYTYIYDRHDVRQPRGAQELGISAVRGGGIVGDHDVLFCGPEEVLTIAHTAHDP